MIYDMIDNALLALANQWESLSESFRRLATNLEAVGADPKVVKVVLDNTDVTQLDPKGFRLRCNDERNRVDDLRSSVSKHTPAPQLFKIAAEAFRESEGISFDVPPPPLFGRAALEKEFRSFFGRHNNLKNSTEFKICEQLLVSLKEFIERGAAEFQEVISEEGQRVNVRGIRGSFESIASYPILTSDAGSSARVAPAIGPAGGVGTLSLQRTLEGAMKDVLGRLPRTKDTRSFLSSLNQSFAIRHIEGHTEYEWTPKSYGGQTDLGGGITGGQASLYVRAQVALDHALPLIDRIEPLNVNPDDELVAAARSILRSTLEKVVSELGNEGGPRIARVEGLFNQLLGQSAAGVITVDEQRRSAFGYFQEQFGLNASNVNTLDEETTYTDFISLRDYASSIRASWDAFRGGLLGKDLGTRLVLLSRALSVAAETVQEVYEAMDSVFVGPAERQVASFLDADRNPVLVGELLSWVVDFTTDEAPRLVYEGGRRGVGAIVPTAIQLDQLVGQLIQSIPNEPLLPEGLRHPRVRHPLQELQSYLKRVVQLAEQARTP